MNEHIQRVYNTVMSDETPYSYYTEKHFIMAVNIAEEIASVKLLNEDKKALLNILSEEHREELV